jgi:hypothetical protein
MRKLSRHIFLIPAAFLLGLMFTIVLDTPAQVCATCGSTMHVVKSERTDRRTSDTTNSITTDTEQEKVFSVVVGDQGDVFTENSTFNKNSDGSTESHEDIHNEDPEGCIDGDGEPMKADTKRDVKTDAKGNRKEHWEQTIEKNGKCIKSTQDWEWNVKGELIKDTGLIETEVACGRNSLEVHWEGVLSMGSLTAEWGPETSVIPLTVKDKMYTGQFTGEWKGKLTTDACNCTGSFPVTIDVKGQEDEFEKIYFTVTINKGALANCACMGKSGSKTIPVEPETYKFELLAQGGATITMDDPKGGVTKTTFILKMK